MPPAEPRPHRLARADAPGTVTTELDPLARPFETTTQVDLLLDDIGRADQPDATDAERSAHRQAVDSRRGGAGRPVLVVDSTPIARKFLARRLKSLGYEVDVAETAQAALERIAAQRYAIVFMEVALQPAGGIDGLRLCQTVKQVLRHPKGIAPMVVFVTGVTGSTDRVRGSLAGCDAYLTKPLLEADLITGLGEIDPLFN